MTEDDLLALFQQYRRTRDEDSGGWSYDGWTSDPAVCPWCRLSGICNYECIRPDPADEWKRKHKDMLDGDPHWQKDDDYDW